MSNLDPRIGYLNSGKFYAYVNGHGYGKEPTFGTLEEIEIALGLRVAPAPVSANIRKFRAPLLTFKARLTNPDGWSEEWEVEARNKTEARAKVAAMYRENTPPSHAGYYTYAQQRFEWLDIED